MVLCNLALSTRRLIRCIRRRIVVVCSRRQVSSKISIGVDMDNDSLPVESPGNDFDSALRVTSDLGSAVRGTALRSGVGMSGTERGGGGGGFMSAARMAPSSIQQQAQGQVSRSASSKRKLEELESGVAESSASSNSSQVRARREPRDDLADGSSIAESSGRERYGGGTCAPGEAQALDGESQMRHEIGNEAIDADAMCDDELVWNKPASTDVASKTFPEGEEGTDATAEPGMIVSDGRSNLASSAYVSSQVESAGIGSVSPASNELTLLTNVLAGSSGVEFLACSDIGSIGRGSSPAEEEHDVLNENELCKEIDVDGIRSRERERRDFPLCNIGDEELNSSHTTLRYLNSAVPGTAGGGLDAGGYESCASGEAAAASETLNGFASSGGSGVDAHCGGSVERPPLDTVTPSRLQFFVRTYIDSRTVVLHGNASDSIETVHQQIFLRTGLPVSEQRLIFGGRQLQHEQTLESCRIGNDATLNLVARMRSTPLPTSWQLVNDMVATIRALCVASPDQHVKLMHLQDIVRHSIQEFLKMATKPVPVSEHIRVFQLAGATSALVMLLLSKEESNRECAEESITQFLQANDDYLPGHIHCHCAPVLLDFCKLLSKSEAHHSLYSSCRNALARLLDTVGVAHGTPYFYEAKADSIVDDFAPFVEELSKHLCEQFRGISHVLLSKESIFPYVRESKDLKEAKDFTAFVMPLCKAMEACKVTDESAALGERTENEAGGTPSLAMTDATNCVDGWSSSGNPAFATGRGDSAVREENYINCFPSNAEIGTHGWLYQLFLELLEVMDAGLAAVSAMAERPQESRSLLAQLTEDRERVPCWAPFLIVLKGMHAIAKLYSRAMMDLLRVLFKRRKALNFLVRQSRWQDDDFWLLEHVDLLDFESKRRLVLAMLPEPQDDHDERHEILVHRAQLLSASFEMLAYVEPDGLQGGISVEFVTEEATGPGVLREWFSMICREIFNCQNALFLPCPNDRRRFFPNPASGVNPGHLTYFRFCGRVIALALMHRVQIDVVFAAIFFKQLAGLPISWEDAKDADPVLYESCKKILEMDAEIIDSDALGLTFVSEIEELGTRKTLELCHGGREIVVNSGNRRQFVELLIQRRLVASVADQIKSFSQGFSDLLVNATHQQFLRALQLEELDLLLYGQDRNICLEDWRRHTEYHDYSIDDLEIVWFWQVVEEMTMEQRRSLLFFSTSVKHLPAEGFAGLSSKFHIHRGHTDISWLPTAHTCFYQLILPAYPTYDIMHTRLLAISEAHVAEGFGFA